jgi:hypothetical protein
MNINGCSPKNLFKFGEHPRKIRKTSKKNKENILGEQEIR